MMKPCDNGVCAFGQTYANELRRRRPHCGDKWHRDEVFLSIRSKRHSLWRAVDQDGNVLDIHVAEPTQQDAAKRFFRKLLKGLQDVPLVIGTELQEEKPLQRGLAKISFVSIRERKGWSLLLDKELFSKNMAQKYWLATSCPSDAP